MLEHRRLNGSGLLALTFLAVSPLSFAAPEGAGGAPAGDFFLRDGDRVVFLGDSLTASRRYGEIVELYTLLTYPERRVRFFNSGMGGDTAAGGLKRFDQTALVHKPTVVTICYGVNDVGWGLYANEENIEKYVNSVRGMIEKCRKAGARVVVMTPCVTALGEKHDPNQPEILREMGDRVLALAREMGERPVDLFAGMREIQFRIRDAGKLKEVPTHHSDSIHLADLGNLAFAFVLLKGMGAPDAASALEIDASAAHPRVARAYRCAVKDLKKKGGTVRFTRLDEGWPMHLGVFSNLQFRWVPVDRHLARYELKVTGLEGSAWYLLKVEGKPLTTVTLAQLSEGVNLAYVSPGPWDQFPPWKVQGAVANMLVSARSQLASAEVFGQFIMPENKTFSRRFRDADARKTEGIEDLAYRLVKPKPLRFEIEPTSAPQPAGPPPKREMTAEEIENAKATLESKWSPPPVKEILRKMLEGK